VRLSTLAFLMLSVVAAGCGSPQLTYAPPERDIGNATVDQLAGLDPTVRENVTNEIEAAFGTASNPVAWDRLAVVAVESNPDLVGSREIRVLDFGVIQGTAAETTQGWQGSFRAKIAWPDHLTSRSDNAMEINDTIRGVGLQWIGTSKWAGAKVDDTPVRFWVEHYDPRTHQLTVGTSPQLPQGTTPNVGFSDTFRLVGHVLKQGRHIFLRQCMHCHGVAGDGNGPTARNTFLKMKPWPRDYRQGLFKFTSVKFGSRPTRDDLKRTIREGLPGTYMPSFAMLEHDEDGGLDAVVEYVRWLSMRGQLESLLADSADSDASNATPEALAKTAVEEADVVIVSVGWKPASTPQAAIRPTRGRWASIDAATAWLLANTNKLSDQSFTDDKLPKDVLRLVTLSDESLTTDELPDEIKLILQFKKKDFLTKVSRTELLEHVKLANDKKSPEHLRDFLKSVSARRGRDWFLSKDTPCKDCHGDTGRGDGPQTRALQESKRPGEAGKKYELPGLYDAWHRPLRPRNLQSGVYRGGRRPLDIYRRVSQGITGTPMQSFKTVLITDENIWDVVNYVLSIPTHGASFDEHGHQYHTGRNSHATPSHAHSHEHPADKPADKPAADSKTTKPKPTKSTKDKKTQP